MADQHYVGEVGTKIYVDVGEDVSTNEEVKLFVKKPTGALATWTAVVYQKNFLKHVTVAGDWNEPGTYHLQAYVKLTDWEGRGKTVQFSISNVFE